jgi:steroid 5-alpha reductase family enzyme
MGINAPYGWITLIGPAVMFFFLFFITGIPHTGKQAIASHGDDYRDYQRTSSMFFPWPPKG